MKAQLIPSCLKKLWQIFITESTIVRFYKLFILKIRTLLVICQVSIDVAWSPDNIDRRGYQYSDLAKYADKGFH